MNRVIRNCVIAIALLVPAMSFALSYEEIYAHEDFSDVEQGAWYEEGVQYVYEYGFMEGYGEDVFGIDDPLTRSQFAKIIQEYDDRMNMKEEIYLLSQMICFQDDLLERDLVDEGFSDAYEEAIESVCNSDLTYDSECYYRVDHQTGEYSNECF
jgi:hypothetical protein